MPLTTFVGRRRELQTVRRYLAGTRFLTLVGPGGCGKTRLAIELARMTAKADVAWVDLAPLRRGEDVQHEVARGLGVAEPDRMAEIVAKRDHRTLLLLDNCEHVLDAAAELAVRFLSASSRTRLLATSREPLDVEGELVWRVPSLSLPDALFPCEPMRCSRADAVKLFIDRAQLAHPGFVLDRTSCPHVVAICRAVDGIPLAIELAAARLRHTSVAELAARLDDLLALLVGTRRGGDPRHRALRAALDWSHALLDQQEQAVFRYSPEVSESRLRKQFAGPTWVHPTSSITSRISSTSHSSFPPPRANGTGFSSPFASTPSSGFARVMRKRVRSSAARRISSTS